MALEVVFAFTEAQRIIDEYEEPSRPYEHVEPRAGTGYGCTEATAESVITGIPLMNPVRSRIQSLFRQETSRKPSHTAYLLRCFADARVARVYGHKSLLNAAGIRAGGAAYRARFVVLEYLPYS